MEGSEGAAWQLGRRANQNLERTWKNKNHPEWLGVCWSGELCCFYLLCLCCFFKLTSTTFVGMMLLLGDRFGWGGGAENWEKIHGKDSPNVAQCVAYPHICSNVVDNIYYMFCFEWRYWIFVSLWNASHSPTVNTGLWPVPCLLFLGGPWPALASKAGGRCSVPQPEHVLYGLAFSPLARTNQEAVKTCKTHPNLASHPWLLFSLALLVQAPGKIKPCSSRIARIPTSLVVWKLLAFKPYSTFGYRYVESMLETFLNHV